MQTFLPYEDFSDSARTLDDKRLGKQRVETLQVMCALAGLKADLSTPAKPSAWLSHPVCKMWKGHERMLLQYQEDICSIWTLERGFKDTCFIKTLKVLMCAPPTFANNHRSPWWLGYDAFHASHRSNLRRKNPAHYDRLFPITRPDLPYLWPQEDRTFKEGPYNVW